MKYSSSLLLATFAGSAFGLISTDKLCTDEQKTSYTNGSPTIKGAKLEVYDGIADKFTYEFVAENSDTVGLDTVWLGIKDANMEEHVEFSEVDGYMVAKILPSLANTSDFQKHVDEDGNPDGECTKPHVIIQARFPTDYCWKHSADNSEITLVEGEKCVRVLHINDFHAYVQGVTSGDCPAGKACDGGWDKIFEAVKEFSTSAPGRTIFVDDGDQFMGTVWSTIYEGKDSVRFLSTLCKDTPGLAGCVGTLGNHEFDYGYNKTAAYVSDLKANNFPVVNSNIDDKCETLEEADRLATNLEQTYTITAGTHKVSFVGYVTPTTVSTSSVPKCVAITDEAASVDDKLKTLKENSDVTIVLSHSGYTSDVQVAKTLVSKPDLIIGGHSHTTLWADALGANPISLANRFLPSPDGEYPTKEGDVAIVQAGSFSRYLGAVDIVIEDTGITVTPIQKFLTSTMTISPDNLATPIIEELEGAVTALKNKVVGEASETIEGDRAFVRTQEAPLGNLICDAVISGFNGISSEADADFCLMNSGGIRVSIDKGDITMAEVIAVLPFGNSIALVEMTGHQVHVMLEHGVGKDGAQGRFPQIGGFSFKYDATIAPGCLDDCTSESKVNRVWEVRDKNGDLVPDNDSKTYNLATNDFLIRGGDGYDIFAETKVIIETGPNLDVVFADYITENSPVNPQADGRITNATKIEAPTASPTLVDDTAVPTISGADKVLPGFVIAMVAMFLARQ